MLTGENGILTQAQRAKIETENAQAEEENILTNYESYLNSYSEENTEFVDSLGNKVKVPAGFKVVNPEDNVEEGIIIEDVTHGATAGSQFVWIPVGENIEKSNGSTFDIKLSRYTFDSTTGEETDQGSKIIGDNKQELANSTYGNTTAKNIDEFISKVNSTGGYYIGRYEARTTKVRIEASRGDTSTQLTEKPNDYVYNYVTQIEAAELSRNMYDDNNFTSDLVNSYAWDTALVFLQECDNREDKGVPYSRQVGLDTGNILVQGTNNLDIKDEICHVFDMAYNCREWTTETAITGAYNAICRGGIFNGKSTYYSAARNTGNANVANANVDAFRPLLYL